MSVPVNEPANVAAVPNPKTGEESGNLGSTENIKGTAEQALTGEVTDLKSKIEKITQEPGENGNTKTCVTMKVSNGGGRRKSRSKKNGGKKPKKKTTRRKSTRRRKGGNPMKFGGSLSFSELNAAAQTKSTGGNASVSSASVSDLFKGKGLGGGNVPITKTMGGNTHASSSASMGLNRLIGGNVPIPKTMGGKKKKTTKK